MLKLFGLYRILFVSLFCLLCSCSFTKVRTEYDSSTDFSALKSYRILPQPDYTDPRLNDDALLSRIRAKIDSALRDRGYSESHGDVDFLVDFRIRVASRGNVSLLGSDTGPWSAADGAFGDLSSGAYMYQFDQGSLVIKILNPSQEKVLWAGLAEREVDLDSSENRDFSRVDKTVAKLMNKFPPS